MLVTGGGGGRDSVTAVAVTGVVVDGHRGAVVSGRAVSQVATASDVQQESGECILRKRKRVG